MAVYGSRDSTFESSDLSQFVCTHTATVNVKVMSMLKARFKQHKMDSGSSGRKSFDLDIYLTESVLEEEWDFDILRLWKLNSERFPLLSRMDYDILAVPISTVASEFAFSTGGKVLDAFRSSLTPKIVEVLTCTKDWLRLGKQQCFVEEDINELHNFEKGKY